MARYSLHGGHNSIVQGEIMGIGKTLWIDKLRMQL